MKFQAVVLVALAGVCAVNAAGIGRVARTSGRQLDGLTSNLPLIGGLTGGSAGGSGNLLGGLPLIGGLTGGSAGGQGGLVGGLPLLGGLTGGLTGGQGGLIGGLPLLGGLTGGLTGGQGGLIGGLPLIGGLFGGLNGGIFENIPVVSALIGSSTSLRKFCLALPNPLPTNATGSAVYDDLVDLVRRNGRGACYSLPSNDGILSAIVNTLRGLTNSNTGSNVTSIDS